MCTLSWQIRDSRLTVLFNRDASATYRGESAPEIRSIGQTNVLAPFDRADGGIRIAVNEYGMIFCVMNDYRLAGKSDSHRYIDRDTDERHGCCGQIIPGLSTASNLHVLRRMLAHLDPKWFTPFILTVFPGVFPPLQWQWDGRQWKEVIAPAPIITTSSFIPVWTEKRRIRMFRRETDGYLRSLDEESHLSFHRRRTPWPPAASIAMKRKKSRTVSLTRIMVNEDAILMNWQPGDPAVNVKTGNAVSIRQGVDSVSIRKSAIRSSNGQSVNPVSGQKEDHERRMQRKPEPTLQRRIFMPVDFGGKLIDIEKIFRERNPALYRKIPRWVMGLLRKVVNEKRLNQYLDEYRELPCNFMASNILHHLQIRAHVTPGVGALQEADRKTEPEGRTELEGRTGPNPGRRIVFLANHPTGGLDGLLLLHWLSGYYPDIRILANDLLWSIPHIRPWLVPIDIYSPDRQALDTLRQAFADDAPLLAYPAGYTARRIKGKLVEMPWKKMPVKLARECDRSIVLIHIDGYNSCLFNSVAWLRRTAGLKINLELLFLSRALIKPACKLYGITVGPTLTPAQIEAMGNNDRERILKLQQMCVNLPGSMRKGG